MLAASCVSSETPVSIKFNFAAFYATFMSPWQWWKFHRGKHLIPTTYPVFSYLIDTKQTFQLCGGGQYGLRIRSSSCCHGCSGQPIETMKKHKILYFLNVQKTLKKQWFLMIFHAKCVKSEQENVVFLNHDIKCLIFQIQTQ